MFKTILLSLSLLLPAFGAAARAETAAVDGRWRIFDVDALASLSGGLEWIDGEGRALAFAFTLTEPALLTVVDGGFAGDRFTVFDQADVLGLTSAAENSYPASVGLNFDSAFGNGGYSRGSFLLAAGDHVIAGVLSESAVTGGEPINATVGAVRLTAVPLPAAAGLYAAGSLLLGAAARRRAVRV